jgi:hypothetical protein
MEDVVKRLLTGICAAMLTASLSAAVPAFSAPLPAPRALPALDSGVAGDNLIRVQSREEESRRQRDGHWHGRHWRGDYPRAYYRGYRGYRYYRPGYRRHGDFWFPPAAFIAGAIIGGALAAPPPVRGGRYHYSPTHVEWCFARYRSYRAYDNTFQPYHGPRRQCRSPYM